MKVVVTGGAGFIGANLCRVLESTPEIESVIALDDLSTGSVENLDATQGVELVVGSILDRDALDACFAEADTVVHLAARASVPRSLAQPMPTHDVNATGTVEVLEAARRAGGCHVIVASSSSVYGANPTMPKSEGLTAAPLSPYAASKLATETYALAWARSFGLPVLAFRFFNVFGPLQSAGHAYAAAIPAFISAAISGEPVTIHGDGRQTRDFTFVRSVVNVVVDAVVRNVTRDGPVNLAFGNRISLLEVVDIIERLIDRRVSRTHITRRPGDVDHSQADSTLLQSMFGDGLSVPIELGLAETVAWFERTSMLRS